MSKHFLSIATRRLDFTFCKKKRGIGGLSYIAQWLTHWPLVLEVPCSIPAAVEVFVSEHTSLHVINLR